MNDLTQLHSDASAIFSNALRACSVPAAFDRHFRFEANSLILQPSPHLKPVAIRIGQYREVLVIAFGKAALPMTATLLSRLPPDIHVRGVCSAPEVPNASDRRIRYYAGGHPLPNADSFQAASEALRLLRRTDAGTFVFFLISGGGSAMFELPRDSAISLEDTIAFHETLVASGATIAEINTVRKHFSAVKGGRLALAAPAAEKLSLLISDVPLDDVGSIASAPTLPDHSTPQQRQEILDRFHLLDKFPRAVREYFRNLDSSEPQPIERSQFDILLSNHDFANASRDHAQTLGYHTVIDNTCDDWDYREASAYLLRRFRELRRQFPRLCLLSSGEVTVRIEGPSGCGGRNQHFALATAFELEKNPDDRVAVLSAGSDGIDGNSPAAGAIVDPTTLARALAHHFDPEAMLARYDSCTLFTALGDTIVTGPTGNNLRDLRVLLSA